MARYLLWIVAFIPCTFAFAPGGFRRMAFRSVPKMALGDSRSEMSSVTRSEHLKQVGIAAVGFMGAGACLHPRPSLAAGDLASMKRSYFRYVPRILESMQWYQDGLQKAVLAEDWPKVLEFFEVVSTASPDSRRPAAYQAVSSRLERELFNPLSVWAQSFAIKGTGPKLRALLEKEQDLEDSMKVLEKAAKGEGLKEGQTQGQVAKGAWTGGRDAIQEFVDIANKGMTNQLNKVDTPFAKS